MVVVVVVVVVFALHTSHQYDDLTKGRHRPAGQWLHPTIGDPGRQPLLGSLFARKNVLLLLILSLKTAAISDVTTLLLSTAHVKHLDGGGLPSPFRSDR